MKENSLFIRRPSLMIAAAIYLAAFILLLSGIIFYDSADRMLEAQREDILDRTVAYAVEYINEKLEGVRTTAVSVRSNLRYLPMPVPEEMTKEVRLELNDASAKIENIISSEPLIQHLYLYSNEAGYAVFPSAVWDDVQIETLYRMSAFEADEIDIVHKTFSLGRLLSSKNGKQLAYTLSVGKDEAGKPDRQVVILLKYNILQSLINSLEMHMPDAVYSLEDTSGNVLSQTVIGEVGDNSVAYQYPLDSGYVLNVKIEDNGLGEEVEKAQKLYFAAIIIGLVIVTVITMITVRFTKIPVNQLTEYIKKNYRSVTDTQGEGLEALRCVVDDILMDHVDAQHQLENLREAQKWNDLAAMFGQSVAKSAGWQGMDYALMLFAPQVMDKEAVLPVVRSVTEAYHEWALLSLNDGIALMLGSRKASMTGEALTYYAEKLLSALDENGMASLRLAISAPHKKLEDIHIAYREAVMARDCLYLRVDVPVLRYEDCDFKPGSFKSDAEYMSRQQHFNRLVSQGKYDEACKYLNQLVPEMFMNEAMAHSEAGKMHLEMVKYQMMSCMDYLYNGTDEALDIRRDRIRELFLCTSYEQVISIMEQLLKDLRVQDNEETEKAAGDETLLKIKVYVRTHFSDPQLSITAIADAFGMSPNNVSKLFSRKAGIGVLQYIHKIRIENACNMMLNTKKSLTDISAQVGYTNTLTFSRAFKARYHMSPSEWRHLNEENHA